MIFMKTQSNFYLFLIALISAMEVSYLDMTG